MKKRKAIVFIDGSNFYHNSKSLLKEGESINFEKLSKLIVGKYGDQLFQVRYYNAVPDISDSKEIYYNHLEFLEWLKRQGIKVKTRKLKKVPKTNVKFEKGIDVLIASDMIRKTLVDKECEVCYLISGDADFIPAIQIIKDAKYEVIICSPKLGFSNEIRQGKYRYFVLGRKEVEKCLK